MMTTSYVCIEGASYRRGGADRNASCIGLRRRGLPVFSRTRTDSHHRSQASSRSNCEWAKRCTADPLRKPIGRSKAGLGLFARVAIKKGRFIVRYSGRKIRSEAADELDTRYLFEVNARWTIDGSNRRNRARYINHSCRPNAEAYFVKHVIKIRAIKNIKPGDEITYHYGRDYFDSFIKAMGCKCRACRKKRAEIRSRRSKRRAKRAR